MTIDPSTTATPGYDVETEVLNRYQTAAAEPQASLCCPTNYQGQYFDLIPEEIRSKDYGCGDPTRYARPGDIALDLGSGAGANSYAIAQKVGPTGFVIGVDFNDAMLALARKYQAEMSAKIGARNTRFVKAKIQDLKLDLAKAEAWLAARPASTWAQLADFTAECDRLRREEPLIADESVDLVVSNCVLNLVRPDDKQQLFQEIWRVLKPGGRVAIADIVCNADPTPAILNDPQLWSGCIAGAFREDRLLQQFEQAGFYGIEILERAAEPWQTLDGIEFRSLTVRAYKGRRCDDPAGGQTVIYRGPWRSVTDEGGQVYRRGEQVAASAATYQRLTDPHGPYASSFVAVSAPPPTCCAPPSTNG